MLPGVQSGPVVDMINETVEGDLSEAGELLIRLENIARRAEAVRNAADGADEG